MGRGFFSGRAELVASEHENDYFAPCIRNTHTPQMGPRVVVILSAMEKTLGCFILYNPGHLDPSEIVQALYFLDFYAFPIHPG